MLYYWRSQNWEADVKQFQLRRSHIALVVIIILLALIALGRAGVFLPR